MANPRKVIRVSVRPYIYNGLRGYRVQWFDGAKNRSYFVEYRDDAKDVKARAKKGKLPRGWAVKV